jgi:hypothetical protein
VRGFPSIMVSSGAQTNASAFGYLLTVAFLVGQLQKKEISKWIRPQQLRSLLRDRVPLTRRPRRILAPLTLRQRELISEESESHGTMRCGNELIARFIMSSIARA